MFNPISPLHQAKPAQPSFCATPKEEEAKTTNTLQPLSEDQVRFNTEVHNAKVRAAGYSAAFPILGPLYYLMKNPEKMAQENRPDQQKESTPDAELAKQKEIKKAQVKAALVTVASYAGLGTAVVPFIGYMFGENPASPEFNKKF